MAASSVPPALARARFAAFVERALRQARERGMTDLDIKQATKIPPSTFHRWASGEGGLPKWEKVVAFCGGLEIPVEAAMAALGITEPGRRAPLVEPAPDPDLERLGRILRDPRVPEDRKQAIRQMIRVLTRGSRADVDT